MGSVGLGIYGSDSESEESSDEKVTNDPDTDQDLKVSPPKIFYSIFVCEDVSM